MITSSEASVTRRYGESSPATLVRSRRSDWVVSDFVQSLDEDVARRAIRDIRPSAEMCIKLAAITVEEI